MSSDPCLESATSVAARIRAKTLSPCEALEPVLARIEERDDALHAFLHLAADNAREEARAAEAAVMRGDVLGPLHGVPIAVKDLLDTADMPTTSGSRIFAGHRPSRDATAVARLRAAGAVLVGKLAMTEFAFINHHPDLPDPANPWDASRSPGGSSSGSAIAAASGMAYMTLGSDTVASIRLPAAWCGVVGLKPTWGRVSRDGVTPLAAGFDCVGPIARCVDDVALTLHCVAGADPRDPTTRSDAPPPASLPDRDDLRGVRVGFDASFATTDVAPAVVGACRAALAACEARGATIVDVALPDRDSAIDTYETLLAPEVRRAHAAHYPARAADYSPSLRDALAEFAGLDPLDHVDAETRARGYRHRVARWFEAIDVFLCPVMPFTAPPRPPDHRTLPMMPGGTRTLLHMTRFTWPWNLAATPALSLPWGLDESGLPIAVQLVAAVGADTALLSIARELEAAAPALGAPPAP